MSVPISPTAADTESSEPSYTMLNTTDLPWYCEDLEGQLSSEMRTIFETYSFIPRCELVQHIHNVPKKIWDKRAYPEVGLFLFLVPWIKYHSAFADIVGRLQPAVSNPVPKFLDVGSFLNHDLRVLHFAGIPLQSLYGLDIVSFWDFGWELFNDRAKFEIENQLIIGDILDFSTTSDAARMLDGKMDVVWCGAVMHQFPWAKQVTSCKRLVRFSKGTGALIVGRQTGSKNEESMYNAQNWTKGRANEGKLADTVTFKHSAASMKHMWMVVGEEMGLKVDVSTAWGSWEEWGTEPSRCAWIGEDVGILEFTVKVL